MQRRFSYLRRAQPRHTHTYWYRNAHLRKISHKVVVLNDPLNRRQTGLDDALHAEANDNFALPWQSQRTSTKLLHVETDTVEEHTYTLFKGSSDAVLETATELQGFNVVTMLRKLAK